MLTVTISNWRSRKAELHAKLETMLMVLRADPADRETAESAFAAIRELAQMDAEEGKLKASKLTSLART